MKTPLAIRSSCLALATLALAMAAATSNAASTPAPAPSAAPTAAPSPATSQQPAQQIAELDEIWVRGKRLADRITDAEDEFFPIYNRVNKDNDYDISCGYTYLSPDSMIMSRLCVPGFLGKDYGAPPMRWETCFYGAYVGPCYNSGYEPPSASFIVMSKSEDLRKNMTKVIHSDPRLLAMADHLGDLYLELNSVQNRYRKTKGIGMKDASRMNRKAIKAYTGPRA